MLIRFHDTKEETIVTLCLELFPFLNILGVRHSEQMPQDSVMKSLILYKL